EVCSLYVDSAIPSPLSLTRRYLLRAAVSPHIAARRYGLLIDIDRIVEACGALRAQADALVVEGAGGFRVPLTDTLDGADLAVALDLPDVLVVGLRLGCLCHALLGAEAFIACGLP